MLSAFFLHVYHEHASPVLLDHGFRCHLLSSSIMSQCVMLDGCWQCVLWLTLGWYCCPSTFQFLPIPPPHLFYTCSTASVCSAQTIIIWKKTLKHAQGPAGELCSHCLHVLLFFNLQRKKSNNSISESCKGGEGDIAEQNIGLWEVQWWWRPAWLSNSYCVCFIVFSYPTKEHHYTVHSFCYKILASPAHSCKNVQKK